MGFIVFGIIMAVVLVIALSVWAGKGWEWHNALAGVMALLLGAATGATIITFCFCVWFGVLG